MNQQQTNYDHHLIGGLDTGNGYVKGRLSSLIDDRLVSDLIDMPSAVVAENRNAPKVPVPDDEVASVVGGPDFFNQLECSIDSPLVGRADLKTFGRKALTTPGKLSQFEVFGNHSKADQELVFTLVLGIYAAKALRDHVKIHGGLPDHELRASVRTGLALPISEFMQRRHTFAAEFIGNAERPTTHLITIKIFETPVTVRLSFVGVHVVAEGASAQFAITDKGEPLAELLLDDLRRADPQEGERLEGVTAADLVAVQNTIGLDVGEGTVNLVCHSDGSFNSAASDTLNQGYGSVLESAIEHMSESRPALEFGSRKELADFLQQGPKPLTKSRYDRAKGFVDDQVEYFCQEIGSAFSDALKRAGAGTEAVFVYGGGSGPIKEALRPKLQQIAGDIPVLYLDARWSRHLNREGLYLAAQTVEDRQKDQEKLTTA
jgi:plasmid segregation protein ParM